MSRATRAVAREEGAMSNRFLLRAAAALALVAAACRAEPPQVGDPVQPPEKPEPGLRFVITGARIAGGAVQATFVLWRDGVRLGAADAEALGLGWTAAALEPAPVDGAPAWRSLLVSDDRQQLLPRLPVAGPETPAEHVLTNQRQPGIDRGGAYADAALGVVTYTFAAPDPADVSALAASQKTIRVGAFLRGGAEVSAATSATFDFRGDGGTVLSRRELVVDLDCQTCHDAVRGHEGTRSGVALCVTCHTWQHADPDTADPAAPNTATGATDPNPLELGRLVHRIHRGKNLPTLYKANPAVLTNPMAGKPPPFTEPPPLPFFPIGVPTPARANALSPGRKFSVVGEHRVERVFGWTETRNDNGVAVGKLIHQGILFPRDLRDCDVCHGRATDGGVTVKELSRRSCQSCHADVFFGEWTAGPPATTDANHFPHTGGPVVGADADARCATCHGESGTYVRIEDVHVPPPLSDRYNHLTAEIVDVQGMKATPAGTPATDITVYFKLTDRATGGQPVSPLALPDVPSVDGFPIARAMLTGAWPYSNPTPGTGGSGVTFTIVGPSSDYLTAGNEFAVQTDVMPLLDAGVPRPGTTADAQGVFYYKLTKKLPEGATGTWAVGMSAQRTNAVAPAKYYYDTATDTFTWPYTGELLRETSYNPVAFVDVASGLMTEAEPRRTVVAQEKCDACHLKLTAHGYRHSVDYCVMCHTPAKTDWLRRLNIAKVANPATTYVSPSTQYDDIEERSMHFKLMVHRIHTGGRRGAAELSAIQPFIMHVSQPYFFDAGEYPNDLRNCTLCHVGATYAMESVPADAAPTVANETSAVLHAATAAHAVADEPGEAGCAATPPITAACLGCHATGSAMTHAAKYHVGGKEACLSCHGENAAYGVAKVHGLK